ncbi:MAG: hypothetical protein A2571_03195 [Candidatus Vogelbacteria bacterium RIFOXYD1_FULL_44_32]|uniref:Ribose-5-phosphate isomerase n=1 Tax=Candidatus Vogelbacteria bacterium RIFOXYD1_FULL_44_32 TaxID=1802438 RepID=A0A1G2QCS8_9BACT|nr:MAG: hypothetical protein A2571_03195 [Candidatus Vogelbacteria bacterium RIFOXYD1_FULL_44_32]
MELGVSENQIAKTVLLATDHAGFELKEKIKSFLRANNFVVEDLGAFSMDETDDYPVYVHMAGKRVSAEPEKYVAIIFGGSGQGEAIVANRYKNVRAVVCYEIKEDIVKIAREHNDANVLSLGSRFGLDEDEAKEAVLKFLTTPFSGDKRHMRRIAQIDSEPRSENSF